MARDTQYSDFLEKYDGMIKRNELMSAHTTFRTGGEADLYTEATSAGLLAQAIRIAREMGIPFFIVGEGSNLLVGDIGFRGLIIRNLIQRLLCIGRVGLIGYIGQIGLAREPIAHSIDGLDIYGVFGIRLYLAPDVLDMRVNASLIAL